MSARKRGENENIQEKTDQSQNNFVEFFVGLVGKDEGDLPHLWEGDLTSFRYQDAHRDDAHGPDAGRVPRLWRHPEESAPSGSPHETLPSGDVTDPPLPPVSSQFQGLFSIKFNLQ